MFTLFQKGIKMDKNALHKLCIEVAAKSPCTKRKVGAVLADEDIYGKFTVIATGYNHNPTGESCECEQGITKDDVIHAEVACLSNAPAYMRNAKMYVTHQPCNGCQAALKSAGVAYEVVGSFLKFDSGKLRMSLVPASLARAAARALGYGAKKYKVNNWRNVEDLERYVDALQRHLDDWREAKETGNTQGLIDADSGLNHLDGVAANLCFLIELQNLPLRK